MEFRWAIWNPKRWCYESAALNMPANLKSSAMTTGLEKVSFLSIPKEWQWQRMFKLPHNCTHLPCQQSNAQNPPRQAGFRKDRGTRDQIASNWWILEKAREFQKNIYFCFIEYTKAFDYVDHNKLEVLQKIGIPDHLTCLLKNLYAGQEATVRTGLVPN